MTRRATTIRPTICRRCGGPRRPSPHEFANLEKEFLVRQTLLRKSISRKQTAELLGLSERAVTEYLDEGRVVGIKYRGRWAIPAWQLDAGSPDGLLPGIDRVARAFPGGAVALSGWIVRPAAGFSGRAPRDLLATDHVDEVVRAAAALTSKGW